MFVSDNRVATFITYAKNVLNSIYDDREANSLISIMFHHLFSWDKIQLRMNAQQQLSESELLKLKSFLNRLKTSEPIQYILGETEFYGLPFYVDENVLIPRQETEELVDLIIKDYPQGKIRILDIGTGSGCIPISLKKHLPNVEVVAIDVSEEAINVAKRNAELNQVEVDFKICDVFSDDVFNLGQFDVIVSNPPYIAESEKVDMNENVLNHEPHLALFVNSDVLEFYERIIHVSKKCLNNNGKIYFELNENYKPSYAQLFKDNNLDVEFHNDLNGKLRMAKLFK